MFLLRLHSILAFPDMIVDKNLRFTLCRYFRINSCLMHDLFSLYYLQGEGKQSETRNRIKVTMPENHAT